MTADLLGQLEYLCLLPRHTGHESGGSAALAIHRVQIFISWRSEVKPLAATVSLSAASRKSARSVLPENLLNCNAFLERARRSHASCPSLASPERPLSRCHCEVHHACCASQYHCSFQTFSTLTLPSSSCRSCSSLLRRGSGAKRGFSFLPVDEHVENGVLFVLKNTVFRA